LGVFAGPSVGYLIGFPIAAFVAGTVVERLRTMAVGPAAFVGAALGGIVVLHILGIIGMSVMLDKTLVEAAMLDIPFLPGDAIKAGLAGLITHTIAQMRPNALLSRA
jgi:biotin transport system substrate-specific component